MGVRATAATSKLWRGRLGKSLAFLVAVGIVPATALAQSGSPDVAAAAAPGLGHSDTGLWIVQLDEPSLATYTGGVDGLRATSPQVTGEQHVDVDTSASRAYLEHIGDQHDQFAAQAAGALGRSVDLEREYRHVLNAVAVEADQAEAGRLARLPGVAAVYPEKLRQLTTDVSNDVIGSPAVWNGDTGIDVGTRGEGVVVGVLDSGINPEHPSFAEVDGDGYRHENPMDGYLGVCDPQNDSQPDEQFCNDKLIGAWAFDYRSFSARDADDHGSHTAATAVGNVHEATFSVGAGEFTRTVSGVAPRANLIAYRVCAADCPITAILSGVDQAIADGVDVLNYSISGSDDPWNDPVDLAFLEASSAGVFVAASAGNNGPGAGTLAHTGPWTTSVAASTTNRAFAQTVDVVDPQPPADLVGMAAVPGDGGPSVSEPLEAPIRDAGAIDEANVRGCASFPAGAFSGAIALIERGDCTFGEKVTHASNAGATAVLVYNHAAGPATTMGGLNDTSVPAVMIDRNSGAALRDFLAASRGDVTVRINPDTEMIVNDEWADVVADFSSRGPSRHDLAAPTIAAPGVNILAAGAGAADSYTVLQGTSMASPHVAGAGALLSAVYPHWTPTQIRSALASTADPDALTSDGVATAGVFDHGGGLMDLASAGRVGLVLDETYEDFLAADPNAAVGGDPRTLNLPALVDRSCAAACSWTRTVTNVADTTTTYEARSDAPEGVTVTAEPASFSLDAGESRDVEFTVAVQGQVAGQWTHAAVTLSTDDVHPGGAAIADVTFPIAVIPTPAAFTVDPGEITSEQEPDTQTEHMVTIGNTGGEDLTWSIAADTDDRAITLRPTTTTAVTVMAPTDDAADHGLALDRNGRQPANAASSSSVEPTAADLPDGSVTLTHSESQHIVPNNTVACSAEGLTADNGYLRTFTLEDFAIFSDFDVTEVSFGVEAVNRSPITVTARLYTLDAEPISYANMTEIGSADVTLEPQALQMVSVPVTGTAPAGSTLVVEIDAPDSRTVSGFFAGSNGAGESAPSYLRSATCGMPEPTPMETAGFPSTHLVMNVTGVAEAPDTDLPAWADVTPTSGTVAAGTTQDVTVTLDSTGMAAGDTLESTLVLESNDPNREYAIIPLSLTVTDEGGTPGEPTGVTEEIIATVPDDDSGVGSLILSVDPQDRTVILPELVPAGDRLSTGGPLRPVTVTDTRVMDPGWDVSAQVSEFASDASTFGGTFLGWSPTVPSASDGQEVSPGAVVAPGFPSGDGLSVPRPIASAPAGSGTGTAVLGADLELQVPMDTPAGVYTALLTITAM